MAHGKQRADRVAPTVPGEVQLAIELEGAIDRELCDLTRDEQGDFGTSPATTPPPRGRAYWRVGEFRHWLRARDEEENGSYTWG